MTSLETDFRQPSLRIGGDTIDVARAEVKSPWNDAVVGSVPLGGPDEVERALVTVHAAFERTRRAPTPRHERIAVLERAVSLLEQHVESLARLICDEAGKPISYARVEARRAVDTFRGARDVVATDEGKLHPLDAFASGHARMALETRVPIGAISAITPFNFPINLVAHKIAPAIAADAPIVVKPAPQAPLGALALAAILREAGLADDRLVVVPCAVEHAGPLVSDARTALLTFTGSAKVGWLLRSTCGQKAVALELGGNAAVIVHDDADLELAADRIVAGAFGYAGQSCISVQRVFAQRRIAGELRALLLEKSERLGVGDPQLPTTICGPVIDDTATRRITASVEAAIRSGAIANRPLERAGRVFRPIWLENVPSGVAARDDELFAPVALLDAYDDFEEALDLVDESPYGLQAGVFTRDMERLLRSWERLSVGAVIADDVPTFRVDAMPYGGVKGSGLGREGPRSAYESMTEPRLLVLRRDFGPRPGK